MKVLNQLLLLKSKADRKNENQIGATMPGTVIKVVVAKGDQVKQRGSLHYYRSNENGNNCSSTISGTIQNIYVKDGEAISTGDLLIETSK